MARRRSMWRRLRRATRGPRNALLAAAIGGVWIVGRLIYMITYVRDPKSRSAGFAIQGLAALALLIGSLIGVVQALIAAH